METVQAVTVNTGTVGNTLELTLKQTDMTVIIFIMAIACFAGVRYLDKKYPPKK